MSMKCDRCGEVFNPEPPDEMGRHMASELAWCLGFNENDSKCYEKNEE